MALSKFIHKALRGSHRNLASDAYLHLIFLKARYLCVFQLSCVKVVGGCVCPCARSNLLLSL